MTFKHYISSHTLAAAVVLLSLCVATFAQDAEKPANGQALGTTITSVEGIVQVRQAEDQPWQMAKAGMNLAQGAEFRTGPRSKVQFKVGDTQTITLDRLGVIKVLDAIKSNGKVTTDLGMKYGRSELKVEAGGVEHESQIHSTSSTLAVRGSSGVMQNDAFGSTAWCTQHFAYVQMYGRGGRLVNIDLPQSVITNSQDLSPILTALFANAFRPLQMSTTSTEEMLFARFPNGRFQQRFLWVDSLPASDKAMDGFYDFDHHDSFEIIPQ
ncbi:hypothetical protein HED60_00870 [Planctomycetales bacterium ZRK34]|nr:hypothetical protein HED60_00870 [Planctomycetales bacterium ZRK34]